MFIFQYLCLQSGIGIGVAVAALLILLLRVEEIVHRHRACLIEVAVQTEILLTLFNAFFGKDELLVGIVHVVPVFLHPYLEQLGVVDQLLPGIVLCQPTAPGGVGAVPPLGDGDGDGGKDGVEVVV